MSKTRKTSRNIFEEVGSEAPRERPLVQPGAIDRAARRGARAGVRLCLIAMLLMLAAMLLAEALARLTGHGMAFPGWSALYGAVPPLQSDGWLALQDRIGAAAGGTGAVPDLPDLQRLYWWQWAPRQLGVLAAVTWLVGYLGFSVARNFPKGWALRLLGVGALMALIGAADWALGRGGLLPATIDATPYRVGVHLGLSFALLGTMAWWAFKLGRQEAELIQARRAREGAVFGMATGVMHLAALQIVFGGLLSGLDSGRGFPDWPLMAGGIFPPEAFSLEPAWRNLFENPGLVQFLHRLLGYLVLGLGIVAWLKGRRSVHRKTRRAFDWMAVMLFGQAVLGIGTVLYGGQWHLALTHAVGAILLWVLILRARFLAQYPIQLSLRG
jgi:cytochrome c oxidase assembly protein subunit 15